MGSRRTPTRRNGLLTPAGILSYLIPLAIVGLTIADFADDGKIDRLLIGACLILGLGALGWRLDDIVGQKAAEGVSSAVASAIPGGDGPAADDPPGGAGEGGGPDGPQEDRR